MLRGLGTLIETLSARALVCNILTTSAVPFKLAFKSPNLLIG